MKQAPPFEKPSKKQTTVLVLLLIAPYLLGVTGIFAHGTWRYEMTVVVETPEGIKTGSAVRQLSDTDMFDIISFPHVTSSANFKGEAVVVDLGERGLLISLLEGARPFYMSFREKGASGASTVEGIHELNQVWVGKDVVLNREHYPDFIKFEDINDPKTFKIAYQSWSERNRRTYQYDLVEKNRLPELFGKGVNIKEIRLRRINAPLLLPKNNKLFTKEFWNTVSKWRSDAREEWKRQVHAANGFHNLSEEEKANLADIVNTANFLRRDKFLKNK